MMKMPKDLSKKIDGKKLHSEAKRRAKARLERELDVNINASRRRVDKGFFGHSKVGKQNIAKNPPKQPPQLGKDRFYGNVKIPIGKC